MSNILLYLICILVYIAVFPFFYMAMRRILDQKKITSFWTSVFWPLILPVVSGIFLAAIVEYLAFKFFSLLGKISELVEKYLP